MFRAGEIWQRRRCGSDVPCSFPSDGVGGSVKRKPDGLLACLLTFLVTAMSDSMSGTFLAGCGIPSWLSDVEMTCVKGR